MSVKQKKPPLLFVTGNIKTDRIITKVFCILFQVLTVLLIKTCKIQSLDLLFFVVFISFYISRYHFSQVFRTCYNIIWKKDFRHKNAMMTLGRTRVAELNQYFNSTLILGSLSSYKPLDWVLPKTFIYGRKTFIRATRCSIDTCKWLEYIL